jgi:hypothetical protein
MIKRQRVHTSYYMHLFLIAKRLGKKGRFENYLKTTLLRVVASAKTGESKSKKKLSTFSTAGNGITKYFQLVP